MLRRIFEPKRGKLQEAGENLIMKSFMTCTVRRILLGRAKHQGGNMREI
jgi:hypothetical protein